MPNRMNLVWVAVAAVVPLCLGVLAAWPLWRRRVKDEMGTIAGAAVVLIATIYFIAREFGAVLKATQHCFDTGHRCHFTPESFKRYAIYAGIGMLQIFTLFMIGLRTEERLRKRRPTE